MSTQNQLLANLTKRSTQRSSSGRPSSSRYSTSTNKDVRKLKKTVDTERNRLGHLETGTNQRVPEKHSPSIINRVFDVLSRGNYAMGEMGVRAVEAGDKFDAKTLSAMGHGFAAGLSGKKKTTFADVLKAKGVKNRAVQAIGGLALDVVADPTNAVGGFIAKGPKAIEVASKGADAVKVISSSEKAIKVAKDAGKAHTIEAIASGLKKGKAVKQGKAVEKKTFEGLLLGAKNNAEAAAKAKQGAIGVKLFGVPVIKSKTAYKALAKVGEKTAQSAGGKLALNAFSIAHHFPGETNMLKRMHENAGVATWENQVHEMRKVFADLTKSEKNSISHAIESGGKITGLAERSKKPLQGYLDHAKALNDLMFGTEAYSLGVIKPEHYNPGYVYHFYKGGSKEEQALFRRARKSFAVGTETPGFAEARKLKTLKEAEAAGLKPITAIDDILALRMAKHQQVIARKGFVGSVIDKYGVALKDSQAKKLGFVKPTSEQKFLPKDMYFPKEIAHTLDKLNELHVNDEVGAAFLRHFDKVQGAWKLGATAVNPGHHIRNMVGDVFNNFEDGVVSSRPYHDAIKVLKEKGKYKFGKLEVTGEQLLREFTDAGGKSGFFRTEFGHGGPIQGLRNADNPLQAVKGLASGGIEKIREASEYRENFTRLAHFIDSMRKEGHNIENYGDFIRTARDVVDKHVNKFNFDYGSLTPFEQKYMKRFMPFYTFTRKNIPLQLEMLALKPGKIATIPKGSRAIENLLGTRKEGSDISDGETIPRWIREMSPIKLQGEENGHNSVYFAPPLPFMDLGKWAEGTPKEILANVLSQSTPALKIPFEQAYGRQLYSGAPIQSNTQYASQQVPLARVLEKLREGKMTKWQWGNYLAGLSMYENTPQLQKGELRRQQDILNARLHKAKLEREKRLHHKK